MTAIRIGTRGSALAMAQAKLAAQALAGAGASVDLVVIETSGDRRAADTPWGEGAFVGAIEEALLRGDVDVAVHSAKDMPTDEDSRLGIFAYLPRADPRDALVVGAGRPATLDELPAGASIGTDSPRRTGFLRARRPDLDVRPLHGNVDTRLRRLDEGQVDALVLACAGLDRLDRGSRISQRFDGDELPPAPGQGAIALQARVDDRHTAGLVAEVDDPPTRAAVTAERAFLAATGGGCRAPVGALATIDGGTLSMLAGFATLDGGHSAIERASGRLADAEEIADELARRLVARRTQAGGRRRVLITRPAHEAARLSARLAEHGLAAVAVPAIAIRQLPDDGALATALHQLSGYDWTVVTSANGARAAVAAASRTGIDLGAGRWAAVGHQTATTLRLPPGSTAWLPSEQRAEALALELPLNRAARVLLLRGSLADAALPAALRARGAAVDELVVYQTVQAPPESRPLLEQAVREGPLAAIVFASPSAVRGLLALADDATRSMVLGLPAVCVGPVTGGAAREAGFAAVVESASADAAALAETTAELLARTPAEVLG